jgi:hypothetical protein
MQTIRLPPIKHVHFTDENKPPSNHNHTLPPINSPIITCKSSQHEFDIYDIFLELESQHLKIRIINKNKIVAHKTIVKNKQKNKANIEIESLYDSLFDAFENNGSYAVFIDTAGENDDLTLHLTSLSENPMKINFKLIPSKITTEEIINIKLKHEITHIMSKMDAMKIEIDMIKRNMQPTTNKNTYADDIALLNRYLNNGIITMKKYNEILG